MEGTPRGERTYYRCAARSIVPGAPVLETHTENVYLPEAAVVEPVTPEPATAIDPWRTLVVIALGGMMVAIDATIVSIANPSIAATLGATLGELQWVTHAYLLCLAASLIAAGKLGDRVGYRRLSLIGIVGFVAASVAAGLSRDVASLVAFRGVQGLFGAALMPSGMGMRRLAFPPHQLSRALRTFSGITGGAVAAGPVVGGALVSVAGWPAVFFVNLPVGLLALGLGLWLLPPNRATDADRPIDLIGVALLAPATAALILGLVLAPELGWTSPPRSPCCSSRGCGAHPVRAPAGACAQPTDPAEPVPAEVVVDRRRGQPVHGHDDWRMRVARPSGSQ
jgi:Major Facilitator Superfamily